MRQVNADGTISMGIGNIGLVPWVTAAEPALRAGGD
jgi:hypothetical protein